VFSSIWSLVVVFWVVKERIPTFVHGHHQLTLMRRRHAAISAMQRNKAIVVA